MIRPARRTISRYVFLVGVLLLNATCSDSLFEGGQEVQASLDLQSLTAAAARIPVPVDSIFVELRRVSDSTLATAVTIDPDSVGIAPDGTVAFDIRVTLLTNPEEFHLYIAVFGDGLIWFEIRDRVTIRSDAPTTTDPLVPLFVGPGADATEISISLTDTTITGGDSVLVTGTVYEGQTSVAGAVVMFESSDESLVAAPRQVGRNQAWVKAPAAENGSVIITGTTLNRTGTLSTTGTLAFYPRPDQLVRVSGNGLEMQPGSVAPESLVVQVIDAAGAPFAHGFTVTFSVASGPAGTAVSPQSVVTDVDGLAATELTAGDTLGAIQVTATADGLTGSPVSFDATVVAGPAATMAVDEGDDQTATVATEVPISPSVIVSDAGGLPVEGLEVTFAVATGDGSITGAVATTDGSGIAAVGSWTLGEVAGENTLTASAQGLRPVTFTATGLADAVETLLLVSGDGQTGAAGEPLAQPLVVVAGDQYGNPVPDVQVDWATADGSVDPTSSQTDAAGLAQTTWTLGTGAPDQTASATVSGITPVVFTATASIGPANVVIDAGNNQTATVATQLPINPSVLVTDAGGSPLQDVEVTFAVESGGGTITGGTATTDVEGLAAVGSWTLGQTAGSNTLSATVTGLTPVTFTATGTPDAPDTLVIVSGNNQSADAGTALADPLVVELRDQYANPIANQTVSWTALHGTVLPTTGTTDASGQAQTTWTLGVNSLSQTATATFDGLQPAVFSATAVFPTPSILLELIGADRIPVGASADLQITLTSPALVDGVTITVTADNPSIIGVQSPGTVFIAEGQTAGQIGLNALTSGVTTVRANATGYIEGTVAVEASAFVLSLPTTVNVPFGGTASIPVQISTPAGSGGETVTLISDNPASVGILTPTVTIPQGQMIASGTLSGVFPGTATVTGTSTNYGTAQSAVSTTANLNILQTSASLNASFGTVIEIRLESAGAPIDAPAGGIAVTLTAADPTCVAAPSPVVIQAGLVNVTAALTYGGSAPLPCSTTLTASAPDITGDEISVTVNPAPTITLPSMSDVGAGLQYGTWYGNLGASNHGGVTVRLTSANPGVVLVSPNSSTAGSEFIDIDVPDGYSSFTYWVQAVEGATPGTVTITASAPGFNDGSNTVDIVTPAYDVYGLTTSTTTLSVDDPFYVRIGIPNAGQTALGQTQALRIGGPTLTFDVANSDDLVGQLVTTAVTGQTVTVDIVAGASISPTSVSGGGVAFDPYGAGSSSVTATLQAGGFIQLPTAIQTTTVTAPTITLPNMSAVGAGLQYGTWYGNLNASNHGGVTVRLTSSDPNVALVSPNSATAGAEFIDIDVADGYSSFTYWVHGVEDATPGTVTFTASAPGFNDGSNTVDIVTPAYDVYGLTTSTTTLSVDDPFYVRIGIPNAGQTALAQTQALRAGGPTLTFDVANSDDLVGQLVTTAVTGQTVTVDIVAGASSSPTSVSSGGVAFDPYGAGSSSVTATLQAGSFIQLPTATQTTTVTAPTITVPSMSAVGAGLHYGTWYGNLNATNHGGVTVRLTSSDPNVALVSPNSATAGTEFIDIAVADGSSSFTYWVQGVEGAAPGTVTLTASAPGFNDGSNTVDVVTPAYDVYGLTTSTTTLSTDDPFYVRIGIPNTGQTALGQTQALRAGGPTLTFDVANSNNLVGQLVTSTVTGQTVTVEIVAGASASPGSVVNGGVAFDPFGAGSTNVTATLQAGSFIQLPTATQTTTVTAPTITMPTMSDVGAGLQYGTWYGNLNATNHGGVTVRLTSSNANVALVSPNNSTAGSEFIDIAVADGSSGFSYWVQGVEGATPGTVTISASAPGFLDGSNTVEVLTPAYELYGLTASTTTLSVDDPFYVRIGIPNAGQTAMGQVQALRAGGPTLTFDVANSNDQVGQLVTTALTGQTVTVDIAAGASASPNSVVNGGVAFDPFGIGSTSVTATLQAGSFIQLPTATQTTTVAAPVITVPTMADVGAGLQYGTWYGNLNATNHGGVTVRLTSSNANVALVSPNNATPGSEFIDIDVADGSSSFTYWVQGVDGATPGTVTISASAPGFVEGSNTVDVVQPTFEIGGLISSTTPSASDDPFYVLIGIPNAAQTGWGQSQPLRAGAQTLTLTITNSDAGVGQLTTASGTGQTATVDIVAGASNSPTSVSSGGVAFDGVAVGTTTVSTTIPGFLTIPTSSVLVTVNPDP